MTVLGSKVCLTDEAAGGSQTNDLAAAWQQTMAALAGLGFEYATCFLRHERLRNGMMVLRSDAVLRELSNTIANRFKKRSHTNLFVLPVCRGRLGSGSEWILERSSPRKPCAIEEQTHATDVVTGATATFIRILDGESPGTDVRPVKEDSSDHDGKSRCALTAPLSSRERQCLELLASGARNVRIAAAIGISENTVEFHLRNARRKLGANTREQALAIAVKQGWVAV